MKIYLDKHTYSIISEGIEINLTKKEFLLLTLFKENNNFFHLKEMNIAIYSKAKNGYGHNLVKLLNEKFSIATSKKEPLIRSSIRNGYRIDSTLIYIDGESEFEKFIHDSGFGILGGAIDACSALWQHKAGIDTYTNEQILALYQKDHF